MAPWAPCRPGRRAELVAESPGPPGACPCPAPSHRRPAWRPGRRLGAPAAAAPRVAGHPCGQLPSGRSAPWRPAPGSQLGRRGNDRPRSSSGRTGSWYHLLVRRPDRPLIAAGAMPASGSIVSGGNHRPVRHGHPRPVTLSTLQRASRARLAGDLRAFRLPRGSQPLAPWSLVAGEAVLLPVLAVRPGAYHMACARRVAGTAKATRSARALDPAPRSRRLGISAPWGPAPRAWRPRLCPAGSAPLGSALRVRSSGPGPAGSVLRARA